MICVYVYACMCALFVFKHVCTRVCVRLRLFVFVCVTACVCERVGVRASATNQYQ